MDIKVCRFCGESDQSKFAKKRKTVCRRCYYDRPKPHLEWGERYKDHPDISDGKRRYRELKERAETRGIRFDIEPSEFLHWFLNVDKVCHYCKQALVYYHGKHLLNGLTIDRKVSAIGYYISNIVLCCRRCNMIKGSWFTEIDMLEIADRYFATPTQKPYAH